jgi:hypothetical protein
MSGEWGSETPGMGDADNSTHPCIEHIEKSHGRRAQSIRGKLESLYSQNLSIASEAGPLRLDTQKSVMVYGEPDASMVPQVHMIPVL